MNRKKHTKVHRKSAFQETTYQTTKPSNIPVRHFFTDEQEAEVISAICGFERRTSAELRVCVSYRFLWKPEKRVWKVFDKLGMRATRDRNGVLIFILPRRRKFLVIGDTGVHEQVGSGFWERLAAEMEPSFRDGKPDEGVVCGITRLAETLAPLWPPCGQDINELPDEIARYG